MKVCEYSSEKWSKINKSTVNGDHSLGSSSRITQDFTAGSDVLGRLDDFIAFNDVMLVPQPGKASWCFFTVINLANFPDRLFHGFHWELHLSVGTVYMHYSSIACCLFTTSSCPPSPLPPCSCSYFLVFMWSAVSFDQEMLLLCHCCCGWLLHRCQCIFGLIDWWLGLRPPITLSLKARGVESKHAFSCSWGEQAGEDLNLNQFSPLLILISHIRYLPIILRGTFENVDSRNNF